MNALKTFGLGLLWALLFPLIAVGIVIVGAFGAVDFVVEFIIMIVNFFRGKKLFPLYPEDEKALAILQRAIDKKNGESKPEPQAPQPQQVFVQQNFYSSAPIPPGSNGALPPGYVPGQIPQGYPQQNPYGQLPPQQTPYTGQIPPQQQPPYTAPIESQATELPPRPELAKLPEYDPNAFPRETRSFDIDIDEGGDDHE